MINRGYIILSHVAVFCMFWGLALWHIADRGFLRWEVIVLVVAASLPFLLPLLAVYVKGVGKDGVLFHDIGIQDLLKLKKQAADAGLLSDSTPEVDFSFQSVAAEDPNLALAGLRIEIEKRLVLIAESRGISTPRRGIGYLLRTLADRELISFEQRAVLDDLLGLLNSAVHGAKVTPDAASWAISIGPKILKSLDEKGKEEA